MTMVSRRRFVLGSVGGFATMVSAPLSAMPGFGRKVEKPTQDDVVAALCWHEKHYRDIAEALELTAKQRPVWDFYVKLHQAAVQEHLEWMVSHGIPLGVNRQERSEHWIALLDLRLRLMRQVHEAQAPLVDVLLPEQVKKLDRYEPHGGMTASISAGPIVGPNGSHQGMMQKFDPMI